MSDTTGLETSAADGASMPVFVTIAQFCKRHPAFTVGGMRHLLFFNPDGMRDACVVRFGRRVLLDEGAFFAWLRANRDRPNLFSSDPKSSSTRRGRQ